MDISVQVQVLLHTFLSSTLDADEWLASPPGLIISDILCWAPEPAAIPGYPALS
jgi:hypothetical protein